MSGMAQATATAPALLTASEAAGYLGLKPRHFRALRSRRPCPFYRFGAAVRFSLRDLDAWKEGFRQAPTRLPAGSTPRATAGQSWAKLLTA